MGDTDPEFINLDMTKDGLALIYRSVCFHLEKWAGGDPREQEALVQLKYTLSLHDALPINRKSVV